MVTRFFTALVLLSLTFSVNAQKATSNSATDQRTPFQVALIGFYNLENIFDTINQVDVEDEEFTPDGGNHYNSKVYLDKLEKLSQVISEMGTDHSPDGIAILGVAEVENASVLEDLVKTEKLKGRGYKVAHIDGKDERGVDVGMLYNPKYFTVKTMESIYVPTVKLDSSYGYTRDVLYVSGELLGEPLHVLVNHWPSRRGGEEASQPYRALAASVNRHKIDSLLKIDPKTKIVVMGDLNDDPVSPSVVKTLGSSGEMAKVRKKSELLYNPWVNFYQTGIGTLAYNDSWNLFDQIIISSGFLSADQNKGLFFNDQVIFKRDYMIEKTGRYKGYPMRTYNGSIYRGGYSDHFPTYIVLLKPLK